MLYSWFGVVSTTVRGLANSKSTRSNADSRGGSRCSTTSTTAAASNPSNRLSRYISDPWINLSRLACIVGKRPQGDLIEVAGCAQGTGLGLGNTPGEVGWQPLLPSG